MAEVDKPLVRLELSFSWEFDKLGEDMWESIRLASKVGDDNCLVNAKAYGDQILTQIRRMRFLLNEIEENTQRELRLISTTLDEETPTTA